MTFLIDNSFHMFVVFGMTIAAIVAFIREKHPIEFICFFLLTALLLFGQFFPINDVNGSNQLSSSSLLAGFANPSLLAVLALLVMGQGILQTNALQPFSKLFLRAPDSWAWITVITILICIAALSAFMNNTPLVVLAIPVVQALLQSKGRPESEVMMPLSFIAILGGMTTLVGSSTNLLVSSALQEMGLSGLSFFQFFAPGCILAGIGAIYVLFILPRFMPDRASFATQIVEDKKEFVAEFDIGLQSPLIGEECSGGHFPSFPNLNVRMIQRRGHIILPPFEGYTINQGDIVIVAATRETLTDILARHPGFLLSNDQTNIISDTEYRDPEGGQEQLPESSRTRLLAEIIITPNSRFIDMSVEQIAFGVQFGAVVLGIQRRARVIRRRFGRIRLEAGDVLLVAGPRHAINNMRGSKDFVVLSGSKVEVPVAQNAKKALLIFAGTIGLAAGGILSIPVAAITGAVTMIATGCLNIRQATRALDRKIYLLVGTMLALGTALEVTEGANAVADALLMLPFANSPLVMASILFLIIAFFTNILTNNACAILFTPIAVNMAINLNVDPMVFAVTVVFAANCSFASPIGYQTNLLVMGPGHYKFRDFIFAGLPLILLLWIVYNFLMVFYYNIPMWKTL
ncbi:MAG: SLC13 family permease [Alphaproteobacteria bacterium]|nr:SLC13 family permease [Alphaproteobacteria bacterium]